MKSVWIMILCAAAILMITMGIRMSLGLFVQPIMQANSLSIAQISFAMATTQLVWGFSQPLSGILADKLGAYVVLFWGSVLLAISCVLVPLFSSESALVLTMGFGLALGLGAGSFPILMSLMAKRLPFSIRSVASGVLNAGGSFGQFLFAPMIGFCIATPALGYGGAFFTLAGLSLLILPLARLLAGSKILLGEQTSLHEEDKRSLGEVLRLALRDKSYILINLSFATCGFHVAFLVTHLPSEVALSGHGAQVASFSLALIGIANIVGSLFVGWCVSKVRCKVILFCIYTLRIALIGAYVLSPKDSLTFYIFSVGLGFTWLATVPPTAAAVGKLLGTRYLASLFGFTMLSHQIGGFFGAYIGGLAVRVYGAYDYMWYLDMTLAAIAALLSLPVREAKMKHVKF